VSKRITFELEFKDNDEIVFFEDCEFWVNHDREEWRFSRMIVVEQIDGLRMQCCDDCAADLKDALAKVGVEFVDNLPQIRPQGLTQERR
jgi:hypothetical protein